MGKYLEKVITITSGKGGVGKTIFMLNLAGILVKLEKRVLIIDCDFLGGGVTVDLNLRPKKTVFNISDSLLGNYYDNYKEYITRYLPNLDVVASVKDPRFANKIDIKTILSFIEDARTNYDFILIDTTSGLTMDNLNLITKSDCVLYIMNNDIMDIKNTANYFEVMNTLEENNKYRIILNNSRDVNLNYFSNYEIKKAIDRNIDYSIDKSLYIKNITAFLIEGEIFTLNKSLTFKEKKDLYKLERLANDLMEV